MFNTVEDLVGCGKYFDADDVKRKVWYGADVGDQFEQCSSRRSQKSGREAAHRCHCPTREHQTRWGALCECRYLSVNYDIQTSD